MQLVKISFIAKIFEYLFLMVSLNIVFNQKFYSFCFIIPFLLKNKIDFMIPFIIPECSTISICYRGRVLHCKHHSLQSGRDSGSQEVLHRRDHIP